MKNWGPVLDNLLRVGLLLTVVGLAASTVWLGAIDKPEAAGITAALCVGLCIFVFLYRFKRFKGMGFEGELWEQEMEQAAELRRALQDLSERVVESVYWLLGAGSRFGPGDASKIFGIIERTDQNLVAVGIDRLKIEDMKRSWHKCIMRDLAAPITERLSTVVMKKAKDIEAEIAALGKPLPAERIPERTVLIEKQMAMNETPKKLNPVIWHDDYENVPGLLRQTIDDNPWLTADEREAIYLDCAEEFRDIDQYARDRTVRRPEVLKI